MKLPTVNGLEVLGLIGAGRSGRVFGARDDDGRIWAVKVFEGMAINRGLLAKMTLRLEAGGWPEGVVKLDSADFEGRPACWVMPVFAEMEGGAEEPTWRVNSLQEAMADHPGEGTWERIIEIASALAEMHTRRVAHGNLKPGNVFFDEPGTAKLADWALGNMPGISHFDYTDALLYQSPEQLLDPQGYFEEAGYRWDVFAFGVLAYRLLTGAFPRCDESFASVAPVAGEKKNEEIHADAGLIAKNLKLHPHIHWPSESGSALEQGYRELLTRCMEIVPESRPVSMVEVMAGFEKVHASCVGEEAREHLMDQRRRAERSFRRVMVFAGLATAACVALGGLWFLTNDHLSRVQAERKKETLLLDAKAKGAVKKMEVAVREKDEAEQTMKHQRDLGLARLEASRLIGDRLFGWAMEKGHRSLPALDGRELRLKQLEKFFEDFLVSTAEIPSLEDERARAKLQLAEIALAAGDTEGLAGKLGDAIDGWTGAMDGAMKLRIGKNALLLALLKQEKADEDAAGAFIVARKSLEEVPAAEVDRERLEELIAILDFHEAKLFAEKGEDGKALEQLLRATQKLNALADARPDAAVLRSELAKCYLSSATILEGIGKLGDAREVRTLAATEMVGLLKANPGDVKLRLELAGCYGAMAEASILSGDAGAAEAASTHAMKLLDAVLKERPESTVAATRKAAQLGLQAGLLRDQGKAEEAMKEFEAGIQLLERQGVRDSMVDYRLALLLWQKGRMLGYDGKKAEEIALLSKSRETLRALEKKEDGLLRPEELQRSSAYLLGDLAHALEQAKKIPEAKDIYREAVLIWAQLLQSRPQSEEYKEGLEWIRQRADGV